MLAMFLAPAYRRNSQLGGNTEQIKQISVSDALQHVLSGTEAEFWTGAYEMEIADTERMFQGGIGFYNTFIQYFVPKLFVGADFKQKLFIPVRSARYSDNHLSWIYPYGMVPTGPFSVFEQFWYFGVLCYYFLARWLKKHWLRALAGDFYSQVVYSVTITYAVASVANDFYAIYAPLFMFVLPFKLLIGVRGSMRRIARPYGHPGPLGSSPSTPPLPRESPGASW